MNYIEALNLLENGKVKECIDYFKNNNYLIEYIYALIMTDNLEEAEKLSEQIDSVRADWVLKLIPIMQGKLKEYPTYFQIRNFLEIDISMLFKANKKEYIQCILNEADIFQEINSESYKFLGRVLLKNDYPYQAKMFLDRSLNQYYNDVELHYLFVEYYLYMKDFTNAKRAAENCIKINPDYYPAKKTLNELMSI